MMNDEDYRRHEWAKRQAKIEEEDKFEEINIRAKKVLEGCSNHGCILKNHTGMATNGACHCSDEINEIIFRYMEMRKKISAHMFLNKVFYFITETGRYKRESKGV